MSKSGQNYKNYYGSYEELLNRDNYDVWAPTITRELQGKDQWSFCEGTREAPPALGPGATPSDQLLHAAASKEHRVEKAAAASYIYNACNKQIQDRYLQDVEFCDPEAIWNRLKEKLQGNDADSRSRLLAKFMSLTRTKGQNMAQFAKKLTTIQKLLNPVNVAHDRLITGNMILGQIYKNAGPELRHLTTILQTQNTRTLAVVLQRYELAEEALEQEMKDEIRLHGDDTVSAMYANDRGTNQQSNSYQGSSSSNNSVSTSRPRQIILPICPDEWTGRGCWYHNSGSHAA